MKPVNTDVHTHQVTRPGPRYKAFLQLVRSPSLPPSPAPFCEVGAHMITTRKRRNRNGE